MSELDQELRASGVGSSEIAMLVTDERGMPLSPYGGAFTLYTRKTGQELGPDEDTKLISRARYIEPAGIHWYGDWTGRSITLVPTIASKRHPVVVDSVDALSSLESGEPPDRCVEFKTVHWTQRDKWGEPGTDQIPRHYILQTQWHMGAHELDVCDVPVDMGDRFELYTVKFDRALFEDLVEAAERFWRDHVVPRVPPEPDSMPETSRWLARRLEQKFDTYVQADNVQAAMLMEYRRLKLEQSDRDQAIFTLENKIKMAIGEHSGIEISGTDLRATFRYQKGRTTINWKAICESLGVDQKTIEKYTSTSERYRVFRPAALLK